MVFRHAGRNPCCSGPTASTILKRLSKTDYGMVAIPVVVDLLLRPKAFEQYYTFTLSQSLL